MTQHMSESRSQLMSCVCYCGRFWKNKLSVPYK